MDDQNVINEGLTPETVQSTLYIAGYLKTQVGKLVKVEFLIGDSITDRTGVLAQVGVSYILLRPIDVNGLLLCDLYSIKFVTIVERPVLPPMYGTFQGMSGMPGIPGM